MGVNMPLWSQKYAKTQIKGEITPLKRAVLKNFNRSDSTWICKGWRFRVDELRNNRLAYSRPGKHYGIQWLSEIFPQAVALSMTGNPLSIEDIKKTEYYRYLVAHLHPAVLNGTEPNQKGLLHVVTKFRELGRLARDLKEKGLTSPIDMWMDGDHPVLLRGYRRLEIIYQTKMMKYVPVRIWRTEGLAKHFVPTQDWQKSSNTIHGHAIKQFVKYGWHATDKYWVHNYTPYYDFHLRDKRSKHIRILELGVKEGMSLDLWRSSFPKAHIVGIDQVPLKQRKDIIKKSRIETVNIDIYKEGALDEVCKKYEGGFHVIIDDALHRPHAQAYCIKTLWKYLKSGGVYVVEDVHPNYKKQYEKEGPETMNLFKEKIDQIWTNHAVKEVGFYPNICFIRKA